MFLAFDYAKAEGGIIYLQENFQHSEKKTKQCLKTTKELCKNSYLLPFVGKNLP